MLTEKERKLLFFIREHIRKKGIPPSMREIMKKFGYSSIGTVQSYIYSLEKKGAIKRDKGKARALRITEKESLVKSEFIDIPVIGAIAAGYPVFSDENEIEHIEVPEAGLDGKNVFALKVSGESMVDAGIYDGDIAVIEKTSSIKNGDIAAVLIDGEVTLKVYKKVSHDEILLIPKNSEMKPITIRKGEKEAKILGKMKGLYRKY